MRMYVFHLNTRLNCCYYYMMLAKEKKKKTVEMVLWTLDDVNGISKYVFFVQKKKKTGCDLKIVSVLILNFNDGGERTDNFQFTHYSLTLELCISLRNWECEYKYGFGCCFICLFYLFFFCCCCYCVVAKWDAIHAHDSRKILFDKHIKNDCQTVVVSILSTIQFAFSFYFGF